MRIGVIDLDTSHPAAWIPILRELGHEVVGVYDGGGVHPAGYAERFVAERFVAERFVAERFVAEHGVARVFASQSQMIDAVDCAILHGCNWDAHVANARPFVETGKAALVDKPLAGNLGGN